MNENLHIDLEALAGELLPETLVFDDPRVFERLGLASVSEAFVEKCSSGLLNDAGAVAAMQDLESIVQCARGNKGEEPVEEFDDPEIGRYVSREPEGVNMYEPLAAIFEYIEHFDSVGQIDATRNSKNSFKSSSELEILSDPTAPGFLGLSPDFILVDTTVPVEVHESGKCSVMWHGQSAFCCVKPSEIQGPKYRDPPARGGVKPIVTEAAAYARLHLSSRPFQLFSVALLIFGSQFCVAIFDREGVTFSPIHNMRADLPIFIRIIRTLTCHASPQDLGQDPTVAILPADEHASWVEHVQKNMHVPLGSARCYPTFLVHGVSNFAKRTFLTIGDPLWISLSLFGEGTSVWLVADKQTGEVFLLKNLWRRSKRTAESDIYESIKGHHPALSRFELGGDVQLPNCNNGYISVQHLRQPHPGGSESKSADRDAFLHRLFMKPYGRPITAWSSYNELLKAIRDAISAHAFLCDQGILHRDINPGNVLLSASLPGQESPQSAGLLLDLEFAHLARPNEIDLDSKGTTLSGGIMTGSVYFRALGILQAMQSREEVVVDYKVHHDLESFIYVLAYGLFGGLFSGRSHPELEHVPERKLSLARDLFCDSFGLMSITTLYTDRKGIMPLEPGQIIQDYLPKPLTSLLKDLERDLRFQHGLRPKTLLTHDHLLSVLDKAIDRL